MGIGQRIIFALKEYKRILTIARKPTKKELSEIMKITALGILLVGLTGFIIQILAYTVTYFG